MSTSDTTRPVDADPAPGATLTPPPSPAAADSDTPESCPDCATAGGLVCDQHLDVFLAAAKDRAPEADAARRERWADYFHIAAGCEFGGTIHDCECERHDGDLEHFFADMVLNVPAALVDEETRTLREERDRARDLAAHLEEEVERLGGLLLLHAIYPPQRAPGETPRWDADPVVARYGWADGRCGRCGEEIPTAYTDAVAERDAALADAATKGATIKRVEALANVWRYGVVHVADVLAALSSEPAAETPVWCNLCQRSELPSVHRRGVAQAEQWEAEDAAEPQPDAETSEGACMTCDPCRCDEPGSPCCPAPVSEADAAGGESRG